ncbi:uncharacterized protein ACNLHF_024000 [Anomaloglossus baeobatrachus]
MTLLASLLLLVSVSLALGCYPAPGATNLARTGVASQITDDPDDAARGPATKAIDGNKEGDFFKLSCTHTKEVEDPWWRVDLTQTYNVTLVVLTNRQDCCKERLKGAEVRVGNSPDNNNPVCGKVTDVSSATLSFYCKGMVGQFVSVVIPGKIVPLTVCEVEVYGDPLNLSNMLDHTTTTLLKKPLNLSRMTLLRSLLLVGSVSLTLGCSPAPGAVNLARTGVASQMSDYPYSTRSGVAKNAIDGNKDTDFNSESCTHTDLEKDPWWRLDLTQSYKISIVVITNRMDCCPERLMGAEVQVGNSPDNNNPVCGKVTDVSSATLSFCCKGMEGQYVSVVIPGRSEYLSMCEVEVYSDSVTNRNNVCW